MYGVAHQRPIRKGYLFKTHKNAVRYAGHLKRTDLQACIHKTADDDLFGIEGLAAKG
jgi:hypothetical protein